MTYLNEDNIRFVNHVLIEEFGKANKPPRLGGTTGALIAGLLSQNTSDHNRDIGYNRLIERFDSWEKVANVDLDEIADAIEPAGMKNRRAPRIKALLETIHEKTGGYSADFLLKIPHDEAFEWLVSQNGIGEKTAAVFLLFHRGAPYFPVDTHIRRILGRIGWFPTGTSAIKIQRAMTEICPPELMKDLHWNIIQLGKSICKPRNQKCRQCPLERICDYGASL
jgi:endonuclease-3